MNVDVGATPIPDTSAQGWLPWRVLRPVLRRLGLEEYFPPTAQQQHRIAQPIEASESAELRRSTPRPKLRKAQPTHLRFLSKVHHHKTHNQCFETHLIDAVRLHEQLRRLELEREEDEERYHSLHSKTINFMAQTAILEEVNLDDLHSTVEDYRHHLAKCEEQKAECVQTLEACRTKIETVHSNLGRAMQSVFATYKDWAYTTSMKLQVDFSFRVTLVKCHGYAQQLRRLEAEYVQLGQERHKSGIDRKLWVKTMKEATRALNSARCAYRKVQEEFLSNHAASALADRAIFPYELSTRNIAKIPESLAEDEDPLSSLNGDFEHRSHRFTASPAEQCIPAMDPEFVLLVKNFRDTKEQVEDIRKRFKSLQDDYARCYGEWNIVHRGKAPFENVYRTRDTNQKFRDVERELIARSDVVFPQHDANRARISEYIEDVAPQPSDSASTFEAQSSDYNSESEAPTERRHRLANVKPAKVRAWQRGVVRSYRRSLDPNEYRSIHSSSAGVRPAYSLKNYNSFDRDSIERRRVRLQKWRERMGFARKDAVLDRDRFLKGEARRVLASVVVVGA